MAAPFSDQQRTEFLSDGGNWRPSARFGGSPGTADEEISGEVLINEVLSHVEAPVHDMIELYNPTNQLIDLGGWRLSEAVSHQFRPGTQLNPFGTLLVLSFDPNNADNADRAAAFRATYGLGDWVTLVGGYDGRLSNRGEQLRLTRADGTLEDEVDYDDHAPWPIQADGRGSSLLRREVAAWGSDSGSWTALPPTAGATTFPVPETTEVVGRFVYYNNSTFDGNDPAANRRDDDAIAHDKQPLLSGQTATFANYTSYTGGINGVMIDMAHLVANLPEGAIPGVDEFQFRVGNDNDPANWAIAPAPSIVTVRPGEGVQGSDRLTVTWPASTIENQWLQVTVLATDRTSRVENDVFYFGNAIGESGNSATDAKVEFADMLRTRENQRNFLNPAPIDFQFDSNRDARVNVVDMLIARNQRTHFLNDLKLISVPGGKAAGKDAAENPEASGRNVAPQQAGAPSGPVLPKLDWLFEYEQTHASRRPSDSGKDAAKPESTPALDVVFRQFAEQRSRHRRVSLGKLDWLYEFEQNNAGNRADKKDSLPEETVDQLLR